MSRDSWAWEAELEMAGGSAERREKKGVLFEERGVKK